MTSQNPAPSGAGARRISGVWSRSTAGIAATAMAVLACYGTLALAALLPIFGLRLAVNDFVWSGAILLFTVIAVLAVAAGARRRRTRAPALAALAGGVLVAYTLLVQYHAVVELAGFVLLAGAVWRDAVLRRRTGPAAARMS